MPLYEYVCAGCEKRFEKYVRAFGEPVACPSCASEAVEKQLSTFAFAGAAGAGPGAEGAPRTAGGGGGGCCGGGCGCGH